MSGGTFLTPTNEMTSIQTIDPLESLYDIHGYDDVKLHRKKDVDDVNYLIRISHGCGGKVETDKDWGVVAKLFEFWTRKWPEEWDEFGKSIIETRQTRLNRKGTNASNEIKYVGALPSRFIKLIQTIFPEQQFDKKFVYALTNKIKITKVGEKSDSWFLL